MSQRITKVRKKTVSGFGDPIPIGAEAQNVTMSDGTVVEDIINQLRANSEMGHQVLTQSEYSALSTAVQNNGTIYFISDGTGTMDDSKHVELTLSQYNALSTAIQNNGTVYFVDDGSGGGTTHAANIQYNHNASQLNANDVQSAIDELKNSYIDSLINRDSIKANAVYNVGVDTTDITEEEALVEGFKDFFRQRVITRYNQSVNGYILNKDKISNNSNNENKRFYNAHLTISVTPNTVRQFQPFQIFASQQVTIDDLYSSENEYSIYVTFIAVENYAHQNELADNYLYCGQFAFGLDQNFDIEWIAQQRITQLAPKTFNPTMNSIKFRGTGSDATKHTTYDMIKFIDNTNDDYGYGIAIGGGGSTIIGGGQSAATILASTFWPTASGQQQMIVANDTSIAFVSNVQSGTANQKIMTYDSNGNLLVSGGGGVFVGANKTAQYTYPGVMLHPEGYICLTNSTAVGSRGGIYFAYNNASSNTAYIKENSSGSLELGPNCLTLHCLHSSGVTGYSIVSDSANGKRMSFLSCNTSTQLALYGQWGSTSSYGYRYVTVTTSDPRLKENIVKSNINALSIINKIPMYSFDWKLDNKHWDIGYIATEMYDIDPNLVIIPESEDDKDKYWSINDFYLNGVQTKAIQELSKENKQLKSQIQDLKQEINKLKQNLIRLENLIIQNK